MRTHISGFVPTSGLISALVLLTALSIAAPTDLSAQAISTSATATEAAPAEMALAETSERLAYADRLLDEAGALPDGGVEAVAKIQTAAMIRFYEGERRAALDLMVGAAEAALESGHVTLAAHALIDGAWIASAMDRPARAVELAERAVMLSIAPEVSEADRMELLRRVKRPVPVMANAG